MTRDIALKSCYKTAASENKVYPNRNTISPEVISARKSRCSEVGGEEGQMCSGRSTLSLSTCVLFCFFLPLLSPAVRVVNGVYWKGLRCSYRHVCVCKVKESVGIKPCCAPVGFEVVSCFLRSTLRETAPWGRQSCHGVRHWQGEGLNQHNLSLTHTDTQTHWAITCALPSN